MDLLPLETQLAASATSGLPESAVAPLFLTEMAYFSDFNMEI